MTTRRVWVVTDQSTNRLALLAFVRHEVAALGLAEVVAMYLPKDDLVARKHPLVNRTIRDRQRGANPPGELRDPVLLFRDTECRTDDQLARSVSDFRALAEALRATFPNVHSVAFNPMSESGFLFFDAAQDHLSTPATKKELAKLAKARRAGRLVNKDQLESALGTANAARKRQLDEVLAGVLFGDTAVEPHPSLEPHLQSLREVLRAGLAAG